MNYNNPAFAKRLRVVADKLGTRRNAADIAGVSLDTIIRHLRGENQPSFQTISRLCQAANMSMLWLATGEGVDDLSHEDNIGSIPVSGFSESKEAGWYKAQDSHIQTTLDLPDDKAFATIVHGQGLIPEGIHPGFLCICSPMLKPVKGDVIHLRRKDDLCSLRVYMGVEKDWLILKAYTDADKKGSQRAYEDKVKKSTIKQIAPVVFVKRKV